MPDEYDDGTGGAGTSVPPSGPVYGPAIPPNTDAADIAAFEASERQRRAEEVAREAKQQADRETDARISAINAQAAASYATIARTGAEILRIQKELAKADQYQMSDAEKMNLQAYLDDKRAEAAAARAEAAAANREAAQLEAQREKIAAEAYEKALDRELRKSETAAALEEKERERNATREEKERERTATSEEKAADRLAKQEQEAARLAFDREQLGLTREGMQQRREDSLLDRQSRREEFDYEQQRLTAQQKDAWVLAGLAHQVAAGEISRKMADSALVAYARTGELTTQLAQQMGGVLAQIIPRLSGTPAGESPPGFESGGSMQRLVEMGGGTYDPKQYASKAIDVSGPLNKLYGDAQKAIKAIPDPMKFLKQNVTMPPPFPSGSSAVASLPPPPGVAASMGAGSGAAPAAVAAPPEAVPAAQAETPPPSPDAGVAPSMADDPIAAAVQMTPEEQAAFEDFINGLGSDGQ